MNTTQQAPNKAIKHKQHKPIKKHNTTILEQSEIDKTQHATTHTQTKTTQTHANDNN